jgi:hypothetical protein
VKTTRADVLYFTLKKEVAIETRKSLCPYKTRPFLKKLFSCQLYAFPSQGVTKDVAVRTPKGGVLVFPHGGHPLHRMHSGELVESGEKYMIRTEVLFERNPESDKLQVPLK